MVLLKFRRRASLGRWRLGRAVARDMDGCWSPRNRIRSNRVRNQQFNANVG